MKVQNRVVVFWLICSKLVIKYCFFKVKSTELEPSLSYSLMSALPKPWQYCQLSHGPFYLYEIADQSEVTTWPETKPENRASNVHFYRLLCCLNQTTMRLEPTLSIKVEVSKHRRTVPFKYTRSEHLRIRQLAGLAASTVTMAEQGLILSAILDMVVCAIRDK